MKIIRPNRAERRTVRSAACRLMSKDIEQGYKFIALYEYKDDEGNTLYYRIRLEKDGEKIIKPIHLDGDEWKLGEPKFKKNKYLYNLQELISNPDEPVWIVEGEKCVDALHKAGVLAVTSGSTGSVNRADWSPLRGRELYVWPDNDAAGFKYASDVIKKLKGITDRIQVVDVTQLGLSEKEDVADWLECHTHDELDSLPMNNNDDLSPRNELITQRASHIPPELVQWLWDKRIALGKITIIVGDPGLGKSLITLNIAAHVSHGRPWPVDGAECPSGSVLIVSDEDGHADTIVPRLIAADADLDQIHILRMVKKHDRTGESRESTFNLASDIHALDRKLEELSECRLVVFDPITAYLGGKDSHKTSDMRELLTPLAVLADKHKVAIVAVAHPPKSSQANAVYQISGSVAFPAVARAVFRVSKGEDNQDRRLFAPTKNNIGNDKYGFAYRITEAQNGAAVIEWEDDMVDAPTDFIGHSASGRKISKRDRAKQFLTTLLTDGPTPAPAVMELAKEARHSWKTVNRAKKELKIKPRKSSNSGPWIWRLPEDCDD